MMDFKGIRDHLNGVDLLLIEHENTHAVHTEIPRAVRLLSSAVCGIVEGLEHDDAVWDQTLTNMRMGRGEAGVPTLPNVVTLPLEAIGYLAQAKRDGFQIVTLGSWKMPDGGEKIIAFMRGRRPEPLPGMSQKPMPIDWSVVAAVSWSGEGETRAWVHYADPRGPHLTLLRAISKAQVPRGEHVDD